jgi:lysophospholipase L1-like esterase
MSAQVSEVRFSAKKTAFYSVILTLTGLGLIEGAARVTQPGLRTIPLFLVRQIDTDVELPFMEPDPELFWKPAPGFSGPMWGGRVTINADGLRDNVPARPAVAPSRRLLCFGDSITFGFGVGDQDTYPAALATSLKGLGIEVRNAGVTGYTSHQTLRWLRRQLESQRIDDATLLIGWNDGTPRPITDAEFAARLRYSTTTADRALGYLAIYRLMKATWLRRGLEANGEETLRPTARVPLDAYAANLEMFVAEARAAGTTPHFIALPSRLLPGDKPRLTEYTAALEAVARRLSVPLYDVGILSSAHPDIAGRGNASYFIDSLHLSPEGNRLMASLLARQFETSVR